MTDLKPATIEMEIELPMMPNFLKIVAAGDVRIDAGELDEMAQRKIAEAWALAFSAHCRSRKGVKACVS